MTSPDPRPDSEPTPVGTSAADGGRADHRTQTAAHTASGNAAASRASVTHSGSTTAPAAPLTSDVVAIHLAAACRGCGTAVPIDALVDVCGCPGCGTALGLPPEVWRDVLGPIVSRLESIGPDDRLTRASGTFRFVVDRALPCLGCAAPLPPAAVEAAVQGGAFCPSCGTQVAARPVPPAIAALVPGLTHVIGEGTATGRGFFVRIDRVARAAYVPPDWGHILAAAGDPYGNVYVLVTERGARVGQPSVLALDPELRTRWARRSLPMSVHADTGLVVTADSLIAWTGDRVSALRLSLADGRDLGRVGAQQPKDAAVHHLDLRGVMSLAADLDGTYLLVKERRLARCAADGTGIPTWPPRRGLFGKKHEKLLPFGADDDLETPTVDALPDHPTRVYRAHARVGGDGRVYLTSGAHVTAVERDGRIRWRATLPPGWYGGVGADVAGTTYVVAGKGAPAIHRIAPDGRAALIVDGRRPETPLSEEHLVVRPDGSLLVLGDAGRMRVLGADGVLYWRSDAARFHDEEQQSRSAAPAVD